MVLINLEDLKKVKLFDYIGNDTLLKLSEIGNKVAFKKGEHIFRDKDTISSIYIILSGKVALYKLNEAAHKKVIFILGEGVINEVILEDMKSSINCEIFESAEILTFDKKRFINIMSEDFELTKIILNSMALKIRRLYRQMKNATPLKIEKRLAAKLWKLSKDYGVKQNDEVIIDLNISVAYLSDMFGMPRETISRALKILEKENLIRKERKKIIIKDRDKLASYFKGL
ncbi:Crp/Fnr family transcriptional regulator [Clostridium baratii]|uniref:Crp/Fnr family transcriptional regulator n=1 Tax=Clostridium baratii TaxID=1561 RepID=UPI0006DD1D3F|nr:Crp/Fnr family transcriptional regulator [Clostridium baratii]OPF53230.1 Crp/Fnr family transcriptional regulator [Clostridium baratii]OPF55246.1 Crp/Fnr family transcriptional regulator [Clostridium baratii]OPF61286.1 Crp/Fnr family transcriptional regulator [Clostridium baratii]